MAIVAVALVGALVKWLLWIGSMNDHKGTVTEFMTDIRTDMTDIRTDIKQILLRLPPTPIPTVDSSPRHLSDYGERIRDEVQAIAWAEQEATRLRHETEGKEPYEVEDISRSHAKRVSLSPEIQRTAYENGFSHDHVRTVLGIVLRDRLIGTAKPGGHGDGSDD